MTIHYGNNVKTITRDFTVSGEKIVSEYISSDDFNLGQIVPVNIGVKNNWNSEVKGVYAEVNVLTKSGDKVQSFKSGPEDIASRNDGELNAYWDTSKLVVGEYDLNVLLHFGSETTQETYHATINLNKMEVVSPTGNVIGDKTGNSGMLVMLIVILIAVNIIGLVIMKKAFGKRTKR